MAGEFQEATRLSDSREAELSFATEIVNPVVVFQMTGRHLHTANRPTTAKRS